MDRRYREEFVEEMIGTDHWNKMMNDWRDFQNKTFEEAVSDFLAECPYKKECKDPLSTHYFMCHMTQEEFIEILNKRNLSK
jgi:hypothetical protein